MYTEHLRKQRKSWEKENIAETTHTASLMAFHHPIIDYFYFILSFFKKKEQFTFISLASTLLGPKWNQYRRGLVVFTRVRVAMLNYIMDRFSCEISYGPFKYLGENSSLRCTFHPKIMSVFLINMSLTISLVKEWNQVFKNSVTIRKAIHNDDKEYNV